ncbi:MAG TPA: hypothetical protein VER11_29755, partial [Polyangiaceae bacterium]|nr:hypothetical protein [Polyangiaceae bacterium]
ITEFESRAIGFHIDHYVSQAQAPSLAAQYDNLMWSCSTCNWYKGEIDVSLPWETDPHRFYRPDHDVSDDHFVLETIRLRGTSTVGEFSTEVLSLNRLGLRRLRALRNRVAGADAVTINGIHELRNVPIDKLPKRLKSKFLQIKQRLAAKADQLLTDDTVWIALVRSPLLDEDPEKKELAEARRAHLIKVRAIPPKART